MLKFVQLFNTTSRCHVSVQSKLFTQVYLPSLTAPCDFFRSSFLQDHPEYSEVPPAEAAPGTGLAAAVFDAAGHLRTWPFRHGLEAFFAAVLRRGAA